MSRPLEDILVIDLSTLLPGPLATAILAAAGARVIKIERPGGEDMRRMPPVKNGRSVLYAMLNRGKEVLELDLKDPRDRARFEELLARADVLVEQYRPGVLARLGLAPDRLLARHPGLVICSITGFGQTGPLARCAGHDLDYLAATGVLSVAQRTAEGLPAIPPVLLADIAGGAYPAVIAVLLALLERRRSGRGCHLDVSMSANLFPLLFAHLAQGLAGEGWPGPGGTLTSGASPRYAVYRTADDRLLAVAPLEERFWQQFCEAIELPYELRDDAADPGATRRAVAERIAARSAAEWERRFEGRDVCCMRVHSLEEALAHPQFRDVLRFAPDGLPVLPLPLPSALVDRRREP
ncbi:MAG: CoA transferase [Geminicoccaceae bacterium]|nr:CoA transferase [Geminicoccaceae bacterium]